VRKTCFADIEYSPASPASAGPAERSLIGGFFVLSSAPNQVHLVEINCQAASGPMADSTLGCRALAVSKSIHRAKRRGSVKCYPRTVAQENTNVYHVFGAGGSCTELPSNGSPADKSSGRTFPEMHPATNSLEDRFRQNVILTRAAQPGSPVVLSSLGGHIWGERLSAKIGAVSLGGGNHLTAPITGNKPSVVTCFRLWQLRHGCVFPF